MSVIFEDISNLTDMFPVVFSNSLIAQKFELHKDKVGYLLTFGIGPYFQDTLVHFLKNLEFFAISFDESSNRISQSSQIYFIVCFWDDEIVCYTTSGENERLHKEFQCSRVSHKRSKCD